MKFDIARQPLVPAIVTLTVLAASALWCADATVLPSPVSAAADGLAIRPLGELFAGFQDTHPIWSRSIAAIMILFTGMCTARIAIRYNLYSVSSCLPVPMYAIVACGLGAGGNYLAAFAASTLLTLASKNFCRAYNNGYKFDPIFRAALYLGALTILFPQALPLVLLLPFAVLLFRRTLREVVVALAGLLLPPLLLCYVNWGAGGSFAAPLRELGTAFLTGPPLHLFLELQPVALALFCATGLLTLFASFFFLSHIYSVGSKPRFILLYNIGVFLMVLPLAAGPAASTDCFTLLAVPCALLLPILFVRIRRSIALVFYLLLLITAFLNIFLQYCI